MGYFMIDVDMVLDNVRSAKGHLSVQGPTRPELEERGIKSRILKGYGPAGGNPLIRLYGSRTALEKYLRESYCKNVPSEVEMYVSMIKPYEALPYGNNG